MSKQKIGILGSGVVGHALADGFLKHGYPVMIGTRNPSKLDEWKVKAGDKGKIGSFSETAEFGDMIILGVKGTAAKEVLDLAGIDNLSGKTIIDATNPIADAEPEKGVLKFFTSPNKSLMEELQQSFTKTNFVKAFSSIGSALMVNPDFGGVKPSMFICGNNAEAKKEVSEILDLFGFEIEDMGVAESARAIEPLCILWCIPGFRENRWAHAFKLLKK
jgi:predicted dinucleotide-binding enzyme